QAVIEQAGAERAECQLPARQLQPPASDLERATRGAERQETDDQQEAADPQREHRGAAELQDVGGSLRPQEQGSSRDCGLAERHGDGAEEDDEADLAAAQSPSRVIAIAYSAAAERREPDGMADGQRRKGS